jgi:zinc transport system substrate-binding protein
LLPAACGQPENGEATAQEPVDLRLSVYAVNYPLAYFASRIGGEQVRVTLPVPADQDPAHWQPAPEQIIEYQQADIILLNGAGYADWVKTASLPNNRLVDTSRGFLDRLIALDDPTHSHGPAGTHSHGEFASHTWLDPALAVEQARGVLDALITYRPEHETEFRSHFAGLERDLQTLDQDLTAAFQALEQTPVLFSHPVYQYLARRYAAEARSLDWEPDLVPDAQALEALAAVRAEHPATVLIWEREPFAVTVETLEAEGLRSIAFETGANRPADKDYLALMRWNLANLRRVVPDPAPVAEELAPE